MPLLIPTLPLLEYLLRPRPPSPDLIRSMTLPREAPTPGYDTSGIRVIYTPPPPPPSPLAIFRAITALTKIYPGARLRPSLQCPTLYIPLGTTTLDPSDYPPPKDYSHLTLPTKAPPITFGPFHLTIPLTGNPEISLRGRALPYYEASDVWSTTPNKRGLEYPHPHLATPYLCKGDAETPINRALKALDYITVCDMVLAVLSNYNHHSPYLLLHCYHPPTAFGLPPSVSAKFKDDDDDDDDGPLCYSCGENTGYDEDRWCNDDGPYCESCFSESFTYCDACSDYAPNDECRTVTVAGRNGRTSEESWCSSCRSSDCFHCDGCCEYFHADLCNTNDHDSHEYCPSCYEDLSDEDLGLCPECHESLSDCTCDDESADEEALASTKEESPSPDGDPSPLKETP